MPRDGAASARTRTSRPTPAAIIQIASEKPSGVIGEASVGWMSPHVPDCRMPSTMAPRAEAERTTPRTSSLGLAPSRGESTT